PCVRLRPAPPGSGRAGRAVATVADRPGAGPGHPRVVGYRRLAWRRGSAGSVRLAFRAAPGLIDSGVRPAAARPDAARGRAWGERGAAGAARRAVGPR